MRANVPYKRNGIALKYGNIHDPLKLMTNPPNEAIIYVKPLITPLY